MFFSKKVPSSFVMVTFAVPRNCTVTNAAGWLSVVVMVPCTIPVAPSSACSCVVANKNRKKQTIERTCKILVQKKVEVTFSKRHIGKKGLRFPENVKSIDPEHRTNF